MPSPNRTRAIPARLFDEVWNQGRLDLIDDLVDPAFINFGQHRGASGLKVIVAVWRTAFPDLHIAIEEEVIEGDTVVQRVNCSGTHRADLRHLTMGVIPATGRRFSVQQIHIFKLRNGRILEHTACRDDLGMLYQLGQIPRPAIPSDESRRSLLDTLSA